MKKIAIMLIIALMIATITTACAEVGDRGEFYPRLAVVTAYEHIEGALDDMWIITCTDKDGMEWAFYGEKEDAHIGTMVNLLMWNMGEAEENDEIIEVYYEGMMNPVEMARWLTK